MAPLLTIEEALDRILEHSALLPTESVAVAEAAGRVVRETAVSRVDLPPFASSAMDGFAVRAADTPGELPVAFRIAAGSPAGAGLPSGSAAAIATGGEVPEGADAVVPVEQVEDHGVTVAIRVSASSGQHVRLRGGDVHEGAEVVAAGMRIGPAHVGALSASGVANVVCGKRPRVVVLATGSELRAPGDRLESGQIYESNRAMIAATLRGVGAEVELLPVVPDEEDSHREALRQGLEADVLVTSGGVSMGPHDLVRRVAQELGVIEVFWGVAVKPGKPLSFGVRNETLVFGLPGNPVSSLVGTIVFVRPALLARQGAAERGALYEIGTLAKDVRMNPQRDEFLRSRRRVDDGRVVLEPVSGQESHMIVRAASADALVHVPRGEGTVAAGTGVRYLVLA